MKFKKVCLGVLSGVLAFGSIMGLSACNKDDLKNQEEYFSIWVAGRDYTMAYTDGDFEILESRDFYESNKQVGNATVHESKSGNKYFRLIDNYEANESGALTKTLYQYTIIKQVMDEGELKTKYVFENSEAEDSYVSYFVADNYVESLNYLSPSASMDDTLVEEGNTYDEFVVKVRQNFAKEVGNVEEIKFVKNKNGSISLKIFSSVEYVDSDVTEEGYQKTQLNSNFTITVKEGKVASIHVEYPEKQIFANKRQNRNLNTIINFDLKYEFANRTYDGLSV